VSEANKVRFLIVLLEGVEKSAKRADIKKPLRRLLGGWAVFLSAFCFYLSTKDFFWPNSEEFYFLVLCAATGVAGQFLLTNGFRYVTAVDGSIISSMRILLAALLGPFVAGELPLNAMGWAGALLLFGANAVLEIRWGRKK
jgi:drug/metabolite transporter (DMT)-like permease